MKKICGSFRPLWLCLLIASMQRCTEQCALQLYCTSLIYVHSKSKVTENIFNLQEWHQDTKIFISYKTFTDGKKTKTCQEWPNLVSSHLIQDFYKTTTFPRWPLLVVPRVVILYRFDCRSYAWCSEYILSVEENHIGSLTSMFGLHQVIPGPTHPLPVFILY